MKTFSMSSERVGESILEGLRIPGVGVGHDDYYCASYLAKLLADIINDSLEPQEASRARDETTRLYLLGR